MADGRQGLALVATALLGAGVLIGCGDDDEETNGAESAGVSTEEVTLTADEYSFELSATPTAETKSVVFDNQGEEAHALVLARLNEGYTVDEAYKLQGRKGSAELLAQAEAGPGKSKTVEIKKPIDPGNYAMLCPIPSKKGPHYKLGQLQEFTIE